VKREHLYPIRTRTAERGPDESAEQRTEAQLAQTLGQTEKCTYCPKMCRHACPVSNASAHEPHIPQAKMESLGRLLKEQASWSLDNTASIWACTGCGHCTSYCEHGNAPGIELLKGRREAQKRGVVPPALANYHERFMQRSERLAGKLAAKDNSFPEARVAFWPGCDAVDKDDESVDSTLRLAGGAGSGAERPSDGVNDNRLKLLAISEACAGYPLLAAGLVDEFRWHAKRVADALRGTEVLVMNCSACLHTLKTDYKAADLVLPPAIFSVAEYLHQLPQTPMERAQAADALGSVPLPADIAAHPSASARALRRDTESAFLESNTKRKAVYYHDPCYHARYNSVIEQPRELLSKVATVREFSWNRGDSECCGGAGLLPKTMPDVSDAMAKNRLDEVARTGGGTVVTSCATCAFTLRRNAPPSVRVLDLPEALEELSEGGAGGFGKV